MAAADVSIYRRYRKSLIETEKGQLLTMARIIGSGLEQYVEQEIGKADLCLDSLESVLGPDSVESALRESTAAASQAEQAAAEAEPGAAQDDAPAAAETFVFVFFAFSSRRTSSGEALTFMMPA